MGPTDGRQHVTGNLIALSQIDFADDSFKSFGFSYSSYTDTYLEAYDSNGALLDIVSGPGNLGTGRLDRLFVEGDISKVLVHDTGNRWLIDDLFVC